MGQNHRIIVGRKWKLGFLFHFFALFIFRGGCFRRDSLLLLLLVVVTFERKWAAGGAGENRFRCTLDGRGDARRT
jgi:hypothetical protein